MANLDICSLCHSVECLSDVGSGPNWSKVGSGIGRSLATQEVGLSLPPASFVQALVAPKPSLLLTGLWLGLASHSLPSGDQAPAGPKPEHPQQASTRLY